MVEKEDSYSSIVASRSRTSSAVPTDSGMEEMGSKRPKEESSSEPGMEERESKKPKKMGPPQPPENWDRCQFYVERKKRFCRQRPADGKKYCGNHQHLEEDVLSSSDPGNKKKIRKRIPCPIDPSHMIFEDNLEKHIRICPRVKARKSQEKEPYFLENVNCGGHGRLVAANPATLISSSSTSQFEPGTSAWAQRIACRVLRAHQSIFKNDNTCDISALTCQDIHDAIEVKDLSRPEIDAGIEEGFSSHRVKSGGIQHTTQIASLIGHLRQMGFLGQLDGNQAVSENFSSQIPVDACESSSLPTKNDPLVILEMGAGRGMFGLAAAGVANASGVNTHFFMLDRAGSRSKADKAFRNIPKNICTDKPYLKLDGVDWCRLCCDVSHVNLPVVLQNDEKYKEATIVVIAKHLCGAGTDLALKSLEPIRQKISGCLLATCCHGVCDWRHYVGRDILRDLMEGEGGDEPSSIPSFGPDEFDLMRRWSAATVASSGGKTKANGNETEPSSTEHEVEHENTFAETESKNESEKTSETNISAVVQKLNLSCTMQGLGRACQRLIDFGRSNYIHQTIFQINGDEKIVNDLSYYVDSEVTPQNAFLQAYRKKR